MMYRHEIRGIRTEISLIDTAAHVEEQETHSTGYTRLSGKSAIQTEQSRRIARHPTVVHYF